MRRTVIDQTTENTEIFPLGAKTPHRPPDIELTMRPGFERVRGFEGQVIFRDNDDVLEHTTWIRRSEHEAHRIKERFRLWVDGQERKPAT